MVAILHLGRIATIVLWLRFLSAAVFNQGSAGRYHQREQEVLEPLQCIPGIRHTGMIVGQGRGGARNFPTGVTLPARRLKHGFQGTINAKNLQQSRFLPSDGGYSPLALLWGKGGQQKQKGIDLHGHPFGTPPSAIA